MYLVYYYATISGHSRIKGRHVAAVYCTLSHPFYLVKARCLNKACLPKILVYLVHHLVPWPICPERTPPEPLSVYRRRKRPAKRSQSRGIARQRSRSTSLALHNCTRLVTVGGHPETAVRSTIPAAERERVTRSRRHQLRRETRGNRPRKLHADLSRPSSRGGPRTPSPSSRLSTPAAGPS